MELFLLHSVRMVSGWPQRVTIAQYDFGISMHLKKKEPCCANISWPVILNVFTVSLSIPVVDFWDQPATMEPAFSGILRGVNPEMFSIDGIKPPADLLQATLASARKAIAEGQAVTNLRPFEGGKKKNKSGGGQGSGGGKRKKEAP